MFGERMFSNLSPCPLPLVRESVGLEKGSALSCSGVEDKGGEVDKVDKTE